MPYPENALKPTPSSTNALMSTLIEGTEQMLDYVKNLDPHHKLIAVAGVSAAVGLGSVLLFKRGLAPKTIKPSSSRATFEEAPKDLKGNGDDAESNNNNTTRIEFHSSPNGSGGENILVLIQCPRGRKTPCIAPFPLKLETFLRVHEIKYELDFNGHQPKLYGSPWIKYNTENITDSQTVVKFLVDKYDVQVEKEITTEQNAISIAYTHLLENHLYWGIALWRWVYDGARTLKDIQLLPKKTQQLIPDVCKTVEQAAWFHGIGKMKPTEVRKAVIDDLKSLSEFLGTKKYFLGTDIPTELDCTAFGMLAQFLWNMSGPFHDALVDTYPNLRDFCWRIRQKYWVDWEDCLNNTEFFTNDPYPVADSICYPF